MQLSQTLHELEFFVLFFFIYLFLFLLSLSTHIDHLNKSLVRTNKEIRYIVI